MPYPARTWAEGEKGTASDLNRIELAIQFATILINVKEPQFKVKGEGADEGAKINEALALAGVGGEEWVLWFPLGTYGTSIPLKVTGNTRIVGSHEHNCRFIAKGNIDLFQLTEGQNTVEQIYVEAETKQASGSAFDLSHGNPVNITFRSIRLGHNFFNGFFCVGSTTEIGALHFKDIHFGAPASGVKGYGNAAFVLGSSTRRVAVVTFEQIHGQANTTADMPKWLEINNTDSCTGGLLQLQNGVEGLCVGNNDTSPLKTTGLHFTNMWCDTMSALGYKIEKCKDLTLSEANAQNCGEGMFIGGEAISVKLSVPTIQSNKRHGIRIGPTSQQGITITGGVISDNNSNAEVEAQHIAGVYIEKGAKNITICGGCTIGNVLFYGEKQSYGVYLEKGKTENVYISADCRIPEKGLAGGNTVKAFEDTTGGEGAKITNAARLF